jgi:outer membrane protein assembly factor BamB
MTSASQDDTIANLLHICAAPLIQDNIVVSLGHSGRLAANHLLSGDRIWNLPISGIHTPTLAGDYLFVVDDMGVLFCIKKNTGKLKWKAALPENKEKCRASSWTQPLIVGGSLLILTNSGDFCFFDIQDGHLIKTFPSKAQAPASLMVVDKILYVFSNRGALYAFG